jgi:hypothetical protein
LRVPDRIVPDRIVIDTNAIVSAAILPGSVPRRAVERVLTRGILLLSEPTFDELTEVLFRSRFDGYVSVRERELFLTQLARGAEFIPIIQGIRECRDPNDDKFLEVALNGRADVLITGDEDLLILNPWRDVAIVTPAEYLKRREA